MAALTTSSVKLEKSVYTFSWLIPSFDTICSPTTTTFDALSTKFYAGDINDTKLRWRIRLCGIDAHIAYDLECLTMSNFEKLDCHFNILIGDPDDSSAYSISTGVMTFTELYPIWSFTECIPISELFEYREVMLQNDTLRVTIVAEIYAEPVTMIMSTSNKRKPESSEEMEKVSKDFLNLFESKKYSDVQIKCADQTFYCHKNILSARSPIFNAMFDSDMTESVTSEVLIQDLPPTVVSFMLKYIYTGKVDLNQNNCFYWLKLLHGAKKYDLDELKKICFEQLLDLTKKSDEHVGLVTVAAHMYNAGKNILNDLRKYCHRHIARLMEKSSFRKILAENLMAFYEDSDESSNSESNSDKIEIEDIKVNAEN